MAESQPTATSHSALQTMSLEGQNPPVSSSTSVSVGASNCPPSAVASEQTTSSSSTYPLINSQPMMMPTLGKTCLISMLIDLLFVTI